MSTTIPPIEMRVAGAPISWGVCEVPGWGWQYDASTVLAQMGGNCWPTRYIAPIYLGASLQHNRGRRAGGADAGEGHEASS